METLSAIAARLVEGAANRALALDADTADRLAPLSEHTVAVTLAGPDITLYVQPAGHRVRVREAFDGEADAAIRATPGALFANAVRPGESRAGQVHISGDAHIAHEVQQLLKRLDPDWDEPLARAFGDVAGPKIARGLRGGARWTREVAVGLAEQTGEYLREESGHLVGREEMQAFLDEVDGLREAVDRLDARIRHLQT